MIGLFLSLTSVNLLCLSIAAGFGYGVMLGGPDFAQYHQLAGVFSAIVCCGVHCIVFTYFIATAKWVEHAVDVKGLDRSLITPTRLFKAKAFPAAILAMLVVFIAAVAGVLRVSYGISAWWHHLLALSSLAVNLAVSMIEYRTIIKNGDLIDDILERINVAG